MIIPLLLRLTRCLIRPHLIPPGLFRVRTYLSAIARGVQKPSCQRWGLCTVIIRCRDLSRKRCRSVIGHHRRSPRDLAVSDFMGLWRRIPTIMELRNRRARLGKRRGVRRYCVFLGITRQKETRVRVRQGELRQGIRRFTGARGEISQERVLLQSGRMASLESEYCARVKSSRYFVHLEGV